jgi:hypothetical protein
MTEAAGARSGSLMAVPLIAACHPSLLVLCEWGKGSARFHTSLVVLCEKRYCFAEKKVASSFWDEAAFSSKY